MSTRSANRRQVVVRTTTLGLGLTLLAFALAVYFFDTLARTLLIGYAATIVAVALNTIVRRVPFERKLATTLVGGVLIVSLGAAAFVGGRLLLDQLQGLMTALPSIEATIQQWAEGFSRRTGIRIDALSHPVRETLAAITSGGGGVLSRVRGLFGVLALALVVLFGGLFALAKPNDRLLVPFMRAVPVKHHASVRRALDLLGHRLVGWAQGQLLAMLVVGSLAGFLFWLIGVPYALLLGVFNGLTELIPILGPWIGGSAAVIVAATVDPSKGLLAAVAAGGIQIAENAIIMPLLMHDRAHVHPFVTLMALLLFGGLFGFLGILLAIPLVILIWTLVEVFWVEGRLHAERTRIPEVVAE
jgi:predicted PurR-regulated permease PerM